MISDYKAQRTTADAEAAIAQAQADGIRQQYQVQADQAREDRRERRRTARLARREQRRVARKVRRAALVGKSRRHASLVIPVAAVGSPGVIAWNGQYAFAEDVMGLGKLSVLLPVAVEGSVLYMAFLAHQAIKAKVSPARYRAMTWVLAGVASGLNCWHGLTKAGHSISDLTASDLQVGVALGLTSLLGIVLLELTTAFGAVKTKVESGRSAEEIRRALVRRLRFPLLSFRASGIRAASGVDAEQAWRQAWLDRYGVGPDSSRRERKLGCTILRQQQDRDRRAAWSGELVIADGVIVSAAPPTPATDSERTHDMQALAAELYVHVGLQRFEAMLQADVDGTLLELPEAPHEPTASERGGLAGPDTPATPANGDQEPDGQDQDEGQVQDQADGQDGTPAEERGTGRVNRPATRSKARKPRWKGGRKGGLSYDEKVKVVRQMLKDDPNVGGPEVAARLEIPESTARRILKRVKDTGTSAQESADKATDKRRDQGGERS